MTAPQARLCCDVNETKSTHLHDFEEGVCDNLEERERHALLVGAGAGKGPVQQSMPAVGAEGRHRRRLHLADAKEQVELGQRELVQAQPQHALRVCVRQKRAALGFPYAWVCI